MMFNKSIKEEKSKIDGVTNKLLTEMTEYGTDAPEFSTNMSYLERITELKTKNRRKSVDSNTLFMVGGNLLGILIIVAYEQKHVLRSTGMNLLLKAK